MVSLIDLPPFLTRIGRCQEPLSFQGKDLLERMTVDSDEPVFFETIIGKRPLLGVRDGRYKLILADRPMLFDLETDPRERNNIYDGNREMSTRLETLVDEHIKKTTEHRKELILKSDKERIQRTVKGSLGRI